MAGRPPAQVVLYEGDAGPEVGHNAPVSSYFDRLWRGGQKNRRFFFFVRGP